MKPRKTPLLLFRFIIMVFIFPLLLISVAFSRFFERALRGVIEKRGLNDVQRILNWRGFKGIFDLAREIK